MTTPTVDITTSGRGGTIYYREGRNVAVFGWEFAVPPAIALLFGQNAQVWDRAYPWAAGRQAEVFGCVGAEVARQKAPEARFEVDLDTGIISLIGRSSRKRTAAARARGRPTPAFKRFLSGMVPVWEEWRDDQTYDVSAIANMTAGEREQIVSLLTSRDVTWREVEVLAAIATPAARAALEAASSHHLSIDTRLAAAEALYRQKGMADLDAFLARQIRNLDRPANGLKRALSLAERHPSDVVKRALLWASYNCTECALHCASLLLRLAGVGKEPFDETVQGMLRRLGLHNSDFDRKAAFEELCRVVNMNLDHEAPC
ncbi:MAG TPA: hypothetical protein VED18_16875 [Candidatus Sulfotelmatobacter sp.]|nr:hypothetical protein [Candidatus Sulfotelmatobacter sp.]